MTLLAALDARTGGQLIDGVRLGTVALVVALALAALPTVAPAQVPSSGWLSIHVDAVLEEPTGVDTRTVHQFNGTAALTSPLGEGTSDVSGILVGFSQDDRRYDLLAYLDNTSNWLPEVTAVRCVGFLDDAGNGTGRCASSGGVEGAGTWAGRIDVETRLLMLDIYLQVVCPRCARR